jgi:hypothetical protein
MSAGMVPARVGSVRGGSPDGRPRRPSSPACPLKVGKSGRYLVDQSNEPVFVQGDSAWTLITALRPDEAERYLAGRQRQGFNSIWVGLIEHLFAPDPPRNRAGDEPFLVPGDFSTPGEPCFACADRVIRSAAERGIQVFLSPCYLGYPDPNYPGYGDRPEGWFDKALQNGISKCSDFGRYVGHRHRDFPNIVWVMGGDRCPRPALEHVRAMADGIRAEDDRHVFTAHLHPECSPVEQYPGDAWLTLNMTYSYSIVHRVLLRDYGRARSCQTCSSNRPTRHNSSDLQIRRQAYWALLCGASGQFMGTQPTWMFGAGWEQALDSPGATAMSHLRRLVDDLPWWDLVPHADHAVVTAGLGEFNGLDYCVAAATQ